MFSQSYTRNSVQFCWANEGVVVVVVVVWNSSSGLCTAVKLYISYASHTLHAVRALSRRSAQGDTIWLFTCFVQQLRLAPQFKRGATCKCVVLIRLLHSPFPSHRQLTNNPTFTSLYSWRRTLVACCIHESVQHLVHSHDEQCQLGGRENTITPRYLVDQ